MLKLFYNKYDKFRYKWVTFRSREYELLPIFLCNGKFPKKTSISYTYLPIALFCSPHPKTYNFNKNVSCNYTRYEIMHRVCTTTITYLSFIKISLRFTRFNLTFFSCKLHLMFLVAWMVCKERKKRIINKWPNFFCYLLIIQIETPITCHNAVRVRYS